MSGIEFKILDVGCGGQPKGDVNCDLFFGDSPHVKNFVRCDAQYLPFKNNSFKIVYSSHVIEHLPCPLLALREWNRVSRSYVYIRLPYAFRFFDKHHLYGWNKNILENLLSKVFSKLKSIAPPSYTEDSKKGY